MHPPNDSHGATASFGPYRLHAAARLVERDGVPVALGSRALDVLIALVERAGEIVSHKQLVCCVWRSLIVDASGLRVHIASLRKALGDGVDGVRYIANVRGQGYSFVAPVTRLSPRPSIEVFAGQVCLIELGAIADLKAVAATIVSRVGCTISSPDTLSVVMAYLRTTRVLLVLDSREPATGESNYL